MPVAIENLRSAAAPDPVDSVLAAEPVLQPAPENILDSPENVRLHCRLLEWWWCALEAEHENRFEQQTDYDFYDHLQWSDADKAVMRARNQAPLTYNKLKQAIDWIIGTERRTRIDGKVHPRREAEVESAQVKSELLKYLSDTNRVPWERSKAFKDQVIAGLGWTEETIRTDRADEPVMVRHVPWRFIWRDPFSLSDDLQDCRFLHRMKFLDLDYAECMFPTRANVLQAAASTHLYAADELAEMEVDLPQLFRKYDSRGHELEGRRISGRATVDRADRQRVRLIETWFRKPVKGQRMWGGQFNGQLYDSADPAHVSAAADNVVSLTDAVTTEMWCAIWTDQALVSLQKSPFRHGQFPFTPYWAYRRNRDGQPYGVIRGGRDAQEDFNKRMSKILWLLSSSQMHFEEGAFEEERMGEVQRELAKPNGMVPYLPGGLNKTRIDRNIEVADSQVKVLEISAAHMHDGTGVNREMLGRETNATSGRAILAKENQGSVTTAELFDNYRLGIQISGEKQLSLTEQFMTAERQFRIAGERKGFDWRTINRPVKPLPDGTWEYENDITTSQADYVVDQQDFRESMRQAFAEQFMEMLGKLDPATALGLLDLAIDMMDIPLKDEVVKRIRQINGQGDPDEEQDPEVMARKEEEKAQQQQLALRERLAKVGLDEAKRDELMARVKKYTLENKGKALDIAGLLEVLLPLAPAADRLLSDTQPTEAPAHVAA